MSCSGKPSEMSLSRTALTLFTAYRRESHFWYSLTLIAPPGVVVEVQYSSQGQNPISARGQQRRGLIGPPQKTKTEAVVAKGRRTVVASRRLHGPGIASEVAAPNNAARA